MREPKVDSEIVYAYARTKDLPHLEEFIGGTHLANLQLAGDRWGVREGAEGGRQSLGCGRKGGGERGHSW